MAARSSRGRAISTRRGRCMRSTSAIEMVPVQGARMAQSHPKLALRPEALAGLNRPTLKHKTLGTLEYINRDGGWWQGVAIIAGCTARMDVQKDANPAQAELDLLG